MIKYKGDNRYDYEHIVTHDGIQVKAFVCNTLEEFNDKINDYDVICIDEIQFYQDGATYCDRWANAGKIIEACGLNGTFERKPFDVITNLLPLVEDITFLTAVCKETGNDAAFSKLCTDDVAVDGKIIGGADKYRSVDRVTYFK